MNIHEINHKGHNFFELLLALHDNDYALKNKKVRCSDNIGNKDKQCNKYVIMYYLGKESLIPQKSRTAFNQLCIIRDAFLYIISLCSNTKDVLLWWYDDGMLEQLVKKCDEQEKAKHLFDEIINSCRDSDTIVHDESMDEYAAKTCADMLYGDESYFDEYFFVQGKPVVRQDLYRQSLTAAFSTIDSWLEQFSFDELRWEDLPELWQKSAGNSRIYVFYLSAPTLLAYGTKVLYRFKNILSTWVHSSGIYCIWLGDRRLSSVLEMLHDSCAEEFRALRKQVLDSGQCLYDEKHRLQQFTELADGYYGEALPGVDAIAAHEKPVVLLNYYGYSGLCPDRVARKYRGNGVGLQFTGGCWVGDDFFFCSFQSNGLYKYTKGNDKATLVSYVPVKNMRGVRYGLFVSVVHYQSKLYCIPTLAEKLMIYDRNTGEWDSVELSNKYMTDNKFLFNYPYIEGEYIWMLPLGYSAAVCMNLRTLEMLYISDWSEKTLLHIKKPMSQYYSVMTVLNESLYFAANQSPHVVEINRQNMKSRVYEIAGIDGGFISITSDGGDLWLTANGGMLLRWHPIEGIKGCWNNLLGEEQDNVSVICHSGSVWLFAWWRDTYVRYDLTKDEFEIVEHYLPEDLRGGLGAAALRADDRYIYIYPNTGELLVRVDVKTGKVEAKSIRISEEMFWEYYPVEKNKYISDESAFIDTNEMVVYMRNFKINHEKTDICGKKIYQKTMSLCSR